jgi:hypothetical protein
VGQFASFGAQRDQIGGDRPQESIEELGLFARLAVSGIDSVCEMMEAVQRAPAHLVVGEIQELNFLSEGHFLCNSQRESILPCLHYPPKLSLPILDDPSITAGRCS